MGAHRRGRRPPQGGRGPRLTRLVATRVCRVRPDVPAVHRAFDYLVPDGCEPDGGLTVGTIVRVPLHGRRVRAWVVDAAVAHPEVDDDRLRPLLAVVSAGPPAELVDLAAWAAWRWAGPDATFLRAASPPNVVTPGAPPARETAVYPGEVPSPAPHVVLVGPGDEPDPTAWLAPEGSTVVVDPHAARARRWGDRFAAAGREVVDLGADQPDAARAAAWDRARAGACVVTGGRTAVWAPVPDLAAVVVVDEGDDALADERAPTWHARDVAVERARRAGAALALVTPAPTVDAWVIADGAVTVPAPVRWPRLEVVDLRAEEPGHGLLSGQFGDAARRTLADHRRVVAVLNRRGRARRLACVVCGEPARCERCGAAVEQREHALTCAVCGSARPAVCAACGAGRLRVVRPGIGRIAEELAALLPRADVAHVDATVIDDPGTAVVVGTEAVLHRLDPAGQPVGLVAFLDLDQELLAPRARAVEQALWLLVRGARLVAPAGGVLLAQTRVPDHEVLAGVARRDPLAVTRAEAGRRAALAYPPFGGLAAVSGDAAAVAALAAAVRDRPGVTVLGPVDDGRGALLRARTVADLCDALATDAAAAARSLGRLRVDVDGRRV